MFLGFWGLVLIKTTYYTQVQTTKLAPGASEAGSPLHFFSWGGAKCLWTPLFNNGLLTIVMKRGVQRHLAPQNKPQN
jgi:hypothetical protein